MSTEISLPIERYLGIDLHKQYLVIGGVNAKQEIVLPPRRLDLDDWPKWAKAHLTQSDLVVVEATTNAWDFYDVASSFVQRVVVANAAKTLAPTAWAQCGVALIAKTRVKTDQKDVTPALALRASAGQVWCWRACWRLASFPKCGCRRWKCANCDR
jgi:hypothetical protein